MIEVGKLLFYHRHDIFLRNDYPSQVSLDLAGYPLTIADTAGIRRSEDEIEKQGVALAKER